MFKKTITFDKLILSLIIISIVIICLFQYSNYIQNGNLSAVGELNSQKVTGIMYYTKQTADKEINQIIDALDSDFSYERSQIQTQNKSTWVKFKLQNYDKDYNIIFLDTHILKINSAYLYVDGALSKLNANENFINSSIKLPSDYDASQYIYIKVENLIHFNLRVAKEGDFYRYQNQQLLFRISNIAIVFVMVIANILLYVLFKEKKYLVHSLLLFSLMNLLFLISGIQKIIIGFNDLNAVVPWSFITNITAICFVYYCFEIKKLFPGAGPFFQTFIIIDFLILIITYYLKMSLFTAPIWIYFVFICMIGFLASIFTYLHMQQLSRFYIVVMLLLSLSWAFCTMAYYGILDSNFITTEIVYLISSIEALLFTAGILHQIKLEKAKVKKLEIEVWTDSLTKLFNRSYFEKVVLPKVIDSDLKQVNMSLLMLDIDHFKNVNDTFGHNIGDILLAELANMITTTVRKEDDVIRWGGEEFMVVLFNTNLNDASVIGEKIRSIIEAHEFEQAKNITISIGVAQKHVDDTIESWVKKADEALYCAKRDGRNRVGVCYLNVSPIKIDWNNVFECKSSQINVEHKELIHLMNDLIESFFNNYQESTFIAKYAQILEHTVSHFSSEENILSKSEYPYLEKHKQIHQSIVNEALEVKNLLITQEKDPSEIIEFLIGKVIMGHMISEDVNYFKYL